MVTTRTGVTLMLPAAWLVMVLVGAAVLSTFEGPNEQANCERAKEIFSDGIANTAAQLNVDLPEKLREDAFGGEDIKLVIMSEDQFNSFVEKVYQMHNLNKVPEVRMMKSDVKCPENWSFVNSIWNAGSMISSLGFSYTAPETFEGKIFTAFFVMIGVPLFFMWIFIVALAIANQIIIQLMRVGSASQHISVFGLLIIVYSLTTLIPAAIISTLENRDFFESWYFATTTISTVGFGDYKLSGVGKSAWLLWIIAAVLLQMITFIVIYVKLTITEFQKQQIVHQEQARLLDQEDGKPLHYGGGMMYRPTMDPSFFGDGPPIAFNPEEYRTLSTLPIKPVDPQVALMEDDKLSSAANSVTPAEEEDKIVEVKSEEIKPAE